MVKFALVPHLAEILQIGETLSLNYLTFKLGDWLYVYFISLGEKWINDETYSEFVPQMKWIIYNKQNISHKIFNLILGLHLR